MKDNLKNGFTLTEIIVFIALSGIIILIVGNLSLSLWKVWGISQEKINISRETILINRNFEKYIRQAKYFKIDDNDNNTLYLNLGESGSNKQKDYYKFKINDNKLILQEPVSDFNLQNNWPVNWQIIKNISSLKISKLLFNEQNEAIEIKINVQDGDEEEIYFNKFYPRVLKQ